MKKWLVAALLALASPAQAQSVPDITQSGISNGRVAPAGQAVVTRGDIARAIATRAESARLDQEITRASAAEASIMAGLAAPGPLAAFLAPGQTYADLLAGNIDASDVLAAALAARLDVQVPCGVFLFLHPIPGMVRDGASLAGTPGCTIFNVGFATGTLIHLAGTHMQAIRDIAFDATVPRTSGAAIHQDHTAFQFMERLKFWGLWSADAMLLDGSNTVFIDRFVCSNGPLYQASSFRAGGACIHAVGNALEVHINHGLAARFDKGIQVTWGSGFYAESVDAVQNGVGFLFDPSNAAGQSVFGVQWTSMLGDTSYADNWLFAGDGPITDVQLALPWASSSSLSSGMSLTNPRLDGLQVTAGLFIGNAAEGLNAAAGKNISVSASGAEYNNISNGTAGAGYHIKAGVSHVTISGSRSGMGGTYTGLAGLVNHQTFGILVDPGPGDYLTFTGNDLGGNVSGSMLIGATGSQVKTAGNAGFTEVNGGATTLPQGQASMTIATGVNAPDGRIMFQHSPLASYAACGISGMSSSLVVNGAVTMTASNAPTQPCQFWWRASAWGN